MDRPTLRALDDLAAAQHGLATRRQVLDHLTARQIRAWVAGGRIVPVRPGVYRLAGAPESWEQRVLAACLSTGGVASHRSAARLWRLDGVPSLRLEITLPLGQRVRLDGVVSHRSNRLDDRFVTRVDGVPATTAARTLVDLSAVVGPRTVEKAVDDALRRDLVSVLELRRCFDALAGRGRRRCAWLRPILEARQPDYEPGDSALEVQVARWLGEAGLPEPAHQVGILARGRRYRIDLAYPDLRLGIELDGWAHHRTRSAFDNDRARGNDLELAGWTVLRFTSKSARSDVVDTVVRARQAATSRTLVTGDRDTGLDRPKVGSAG
jgi:predicted transcriptional regulator of viral defense system